MEKSQAKGQSSVEYILIVALTFALIIPATYLFYTYSKDSGQEVTDAQITQIGKSIVDTAETIYYSGIGSKTILEMNVPEAITSAVIIEGRELVFNVTSEIGISEIVFFSKINITTLPSYCNGNVCTIPGISEGGLRKFKIDAVSRNSVRIDIT